MPTGDILSSQTQALTMWKNTVVLWGGEDLVERLETVLFQASIVLVKYQGCRQGIQVSFLERELSLYLTLSA